MKKILILFLVVGLFSCSLFKKAQAPPHNTVTEEMSKDIKDRINNMYQDMINSPNRNFAEWEIPYHGIDLQLHTLISLDSMRPNNTVILKLVRSWDARFEKYIDEHRLYDVINTGQITNYQNLMNNIGNHVYQTEKNLK